MRAGGHSDEGDQSMHAHPQPQRQFKLHSIAVQWRQHASPHQASPVAPVPAAAPPWPSPEVIVQHVAAAYDLTPALLRSKRRDLYTVEARRVTMCLLVAAGLSASATGRLL